MTLLPTDVLPASAFVAFARDADERFLLQFIARRAQAVPTDRPMLKRFAADLYEKRFGVPPTDAHALRHYVNDNDWVE